MREIKSLLSPLTVMARTAVNRLPRYCSPACESLITACVIVIEMIDGHALVISLTAIALISSQVSKYFSRY